MTDQIELEAVRARGNQYGFIVRPKGSTGWSGRIGDWEWHSRIVVALSPESACEKARKFFVMDFKDMGVDI